MKASIVSKGARGTFPAPFFMACLVAIRLKVVRLENV
jgi:hypothetical protein